MQIFITWFQTLFSNIYSVDSDLPDGFSYCTLDQENLAELDSRKPINKSILPYIEPPPAQGPLNISFTESGPSSVVAGCVSAVSGDYFESEVDFILPGSEPIPVER